MRWRKPERAVLSSGNEAEPTTGDRMTRSRLSFQSLSLPSFRLISFLFASLLVKDETKLAAFNMSV